MNLATLVCGPLWDSIVPRDDPLPILRNMPSLTLAHFEVAKEFRLFLTILICEDEKSSVKGEFKTISKFPKQFFYV